MNKKVVRRMIKRIQSVPESYDQTAFFVREDETAPCGTVACLAGEAVICSAKTVKDGIKLAFDNFDSIPRLAMDVLGLPENHGIFDCGGYGWPQPYRDALKKAQNGKAKADIAVAYLQESLKRGTMIWTVKEVVK